jgi:serine/threonine protein kinase
MPISTGTRLGSYELVAQIGAGGMGEVYKAHDSKLGRDVAIKVLPEDQPRLAERETKVREARP